MANPFAKIEDTFYFNWIEVGVALIKFKGIHAGRWHVGLQFDVHGAQVNIPVTQQQHAMVPASMVTVLNVNLRQLKPTEPSDPLTIDAAEVNPRQNLITPVGMHIQ